MDKEQKDIAKLAQEIVDSATRVNETLEKRRIIQNAIETAVSEVKAKEQVEHIVARAAAEKKLPAKNTAEFIDKYYKKRFSPSTAGKAYLLSFLLDAYSMSEKGIQTSLWDIETLKSKINTDEDIRSFDAYYHLTEWLRNLYENSRTMRNALQGTLSDFYHTVTSILAAENIRACVIDSYFTDKGSESSGEDQDKDPETILTLWINTISLEAYTPQSDGGYLLYALRTNIGEGLRYLVAYHTFLDVIAEYTGIPECSYLKIKMDNIRDSLASLNKALELLRKNVKKYRGPEITEAIVKKRLPHATRVLWTQDYLDTTMRAFRPVGEEPPVPEDRVIFLKESIRREFKQSYINWYVLYSRYSVNYRMPENLKAPTTGRDILSETEKAQAEEGE